MVSINFRGKEICVKENGQWTYKDSGLPLSDIDALSMRITQALDEAGIIRANNSGENVRKLSIIITKLEEADLWAGSIKYGTD